jgi:hypothetical protein
MPFGSTRRVFRSRDLVGWRIQFRSGPTFRDGRAGVVGTSVDSPGVIGTSTQSFGVAGQSGAPGPSSSSAGAGATGAGLREIEAEAIGGGHGDPSSAAEMARRGGERKRSADAREAMAPQ